MGFAIRQSTLCRVAGTALAVAALAALIAPPAQAGTPDDLAQLQRLMDRGDFARALDQARYLASINPLLQDLPNEVLGERSFFQGNHSEALERYRAITPPGGCLISHVPDYRNSCQRMGQILGDMGDLYGVLDMERRLVHGAGVRDSSPPVDSYQKLAQSYEDVGDIPGANAVHAAVAYFFDAPKAARQARETLDDRGALVAGTDDLILRHALSPDVVLARAGRIALARLADPASAFDRLLEEIVEEGGGQSRRLEILVRLPMADLEGRLHYILVEGPPEYRAVAHDALKKRSGLSYPYLDGDGIIQFEPGRSSFFRGRWATPYLLSIVQDPYEVEAGRLMALAALGQVEDPRALEPLLQATHHERAVWRVTALRALEAHHGDAVEKVVVALISDPDPQVRVTAAASIARRGLPEAVDLLAQALARETHPLFAAALTEALASRAVHDEEHVRDVLADLAKKLENAAAAKAAESLFMAGDPRGVALLESLVSAPAPAGRWAADALASPRRTSPGQQLETPLLDQLVPRGRQLEPPKELHEDSTADEILLASLMGTPAPERTVRRLLDSKLWSNQRAAILALANVGSRDHLAAIRRLARTSRYGAQGDEIVTYNQYALRALGWLEDEESLPLFHEVLASKTYGSPRMAAAWALGRLHDEDSILALVATFADATVPFRVRKAAAQGLSRFRDRDLGSLFLGQLESPDPRIRRLTILLLEDTGAGQGQDEVQRLAEVDPDPAIRQLAARVATVLGH